MSADNQDIYGHALKLAGPEQAALSGATHVCLRKEVQFHTGGKKDQLEPRVLILTTTRCYILSSKQHGRTEISQQFHFLRLGRVESLAAKQLTFYLNGDSQPRKINMLIDDDCMEVTAAIVSQLRNVLPSAPKDQLVSMQFDPTNRKQQLNQLLAQLQDIMQPTDMSDCGGYVTTYGFLVDYFSCPFREEVSWDIDNIYVSHGFKQLNLADFHHLDSKELQPVILALRYNNYFDGLIEKNFKLSNESFDTISQVFLSNLSLKTLTLDNVGLRSDQIMKICSSITLNKKTPLTHLDLSNNHLDDKGFELLAGSLEGLPHGLEMLSLANTGMSNRAATMLSSAMKKNTHFASTLNKMDWSSNIIGPDSMAPLAFLQDSNNVVHLNLSNCQLVLETVLATLRRGCCQHLSYLNLSTNNKPVKKRDNPLSGKTVNEFFSKVIAMETIVMSNCKLLIDAATALLRGIKSNPNIIKITLDISSNELGNGNVKDFVSVLTNCSTLHSLDISDNGLEEQLDQILKAVLANTAVRHLAIGRNFIRLKNPSMLLSNLVKLINKDTTKLESLSLADSKLRNHTVIILNGLGLNQCVTTLDISGNEMGDRGAHSLAKLLLVNNTLRSISWDHNLTGLAGFEDVSNALEHNWTMRSMPTPLSDTLRISREAGVESTVQHIQQLLFRNHSPDRSMVELASRRNKYTHITSSRQQELDRSLVQLEDLLKMIPTKSLTEPSVQHARNIKEEAYKVSQLMFGLYPPKLEAEQANAIAEQMRAVARPMQQKLFQEQIQENSERMVSLCDKTCPIIFGQPEAKQSLRELIVTTKDDKFLENELVTVATQAVTTCISGSNLTTSSVISECVFEHVLSTLDDCIEQLVPLKHADITDAPQQKPRPVSFRVKQNQKVNKKEKSKTVMSPKDKLPELIVEAPMKNVAITKNRAQRPVRTHKVTRPSRLPETSDITDAPSLLTLEEETTPNATPSPVKSPTKSPVPMSPTKSLSSPLPKSPTLTKSPSLTKSLSRNVSPSIPSSESPADEPSVEEVTTSEAIGEKEIEAKEEKTETEGDKKQEDEVNQGDVKEEKATLRESMVIGKDDKTQSPGMAKEDKKQKGKEKEKEDKKLQKEKEKEEKRLQKEREKEEKKKQKEKEKEEKKQQKNAKKVSKQVGDDKELLESSTDKRSSLRKSMEVSTSKLTTSQEGLVESETPADAAVKKVPPPTKAKPKPPAQELVKKPVLPPSAALASSTLANVLKEGRKQNMGEKKALPSVAKKPDRKGDNQAADEQDDDNDEGKIEEDKKVPPTVAKKPPKKDETQDDSTEDKTDVDDGDKGEDKKASPPTVAKKPRKKEIDDTTDIKQHVGDDEDRKTAPSTVTETKKDNQEDGSTDGVDEQRDKDKRAGREEEKTSPPIVAKKPSKKDIEKKDVTDDKQKKDVTDDKERKDVTDDKEKKDVTDDKEKKDVTDDKESTGESEDDRAVPTNHDVDDKNDTDRAATQDNDKTEPEDSESKVTDDDNKTGGDKLVDDKVSDEDNDKDDKKESDKEDSIGPSVKVVDDEISTI